MCSFSCFQYLVLDVIPLFNVPVVMQDGEEEFKVESIISHRRQRGNSQYLVKWLGWPLSESTWEDKKQLTHCDSALKNFHEEAGRRSSVKRGAV
jgi:hypothetical protein